MRKIFGGGGGSSTSESYTGYGALPPHLQRRFDQLVNSGYDLIANPEAYFAPIPLTEQELEARRLIEAYQDPVEYRESIEAHLNPYRDIVISDINRQFREPQGALARRASEAGAFGSSRQRGVEADLEGARLDSIQRGLASQYNQALGQRQQTIANLLGFGGLEREVELGRSMALPRALQTYSGILNPLLNSTRRVQTQKSGGGGLLGGLGNIGSGLSALGSLGFGVPGIGTGFGFGGFGQSIGSLFSDSSYGPYLPFGYSPY